MKKFVTLYLTFFLFICSLTAQNTIWPVQVTGALVPPHSLDLKVYGTDRVNDLNFQVFLKDPVEQSLQVRPVLTIEQNGTILYQTDMNFNGDILTLTQFEPFVLDGTILNRYLSSEALTGRAEQGRGATLIPEGFNQICLQMYGVERSVPVSNKFCVAGNFRLNQPPQIIKPAFNEKIKMPEVQNMIFSWMPMHLGSGNNPGAVDYFFELVALPQGVMNANDFFDSALKVYSTTTNATSFIYSQAEPPLQPGVYYAWRVKASSMLHPTSTLFQNEGKSEISVFVLYEGEVPTNDLNPFDNPAPRGCSVYETGYGPVSKADNEPMILAPNQDVKLGFFNMKVTEASGNSQVGYSGKGLIAFPMLRSTLEVVFTNVKVNKEGRVYESESIEAGSGPFTLSKEQLSPENIARYVNNQYTADLYRSINDSKKVSLLTDDVSRRNELPLALVNEQNPSMMVCVTGIYFTPSHAFLNMVGLNDTGEGSTFDISAATAIQATPYGLKSGSYLVPISRSSGPGSARQIIPTIEMMVSTDGSSKLFCDCSGITESKLKENLRISKDIIVRADNGGPVVLELSDKKADAKTYFGEVKGLPAFEINGLEGFRFNANKVMVDLSNTKTMENGAKFQASEEGILDPTWRGAVIQEASVSLPEAYNVFSGKGRLTLDKGEILLNENNIPYGSFSKENLISIDNGKVENWRYSVDKYSLEFLKGQIVGPSISGRLKLPVADDLINYNGELLQSGNSNASMNITMPSGDLKIGMWSANMSLSDETSIGLEIKNLGNEKMMYPSAKLSGDLNVNVSNSVLGEKLKGNIAQTLADMKQALNATSDDLSFSISGLHINNWNLSPYDLPENRYTANSVEVEKARFVLGGKSYAVTHGEILKRTIDNIEQVGMSVVIKEGNNKINVILWGAENNGTFALDQIEAQIIDIRCNCTVEPGSIGKVELQKLYDKLIDEAYADMVQSDVSSSGKQSSEIQDHIEFQVFHAKMKSELELNTTEGGWIVQDGKVNIPFLDIKIKVNKSGNKLEGVKKDISFVKKMSDFDNFEREDQLPVVVNAELFKKLGFHTTYDIPANSRLLISGFEVENDKLSEGTFTFTLFTSIENSDGKDKSEGVPSTLLQFISDPVKITNSPTNGIKIANLELMLQEDYSQEDYEFKVSITENEKTKLSIARVDCINGFDYFDMVGFYKPQNLVPVKEQALQMIFTLNTSLHGNAHDLNDFIGVISEFNEKGEKWKFHLPNEPYLIFTPGGSFKMYLDKSSRLKIPGDFVSGSFGSATSNSSFKGIVFEKMSFEILGFNDNHGNHIQYPISDVVYEAAPKGEQKGLNTSFFKDGTLSHRDHNGKFSGWRYELESASFTIENNTFTYNLEIDGKLLVPLFRAAPKKSTSVRFSDPWVGFSGTVFSDKEGNTINVYSNFLLENIVDSTYLSDFIPGLGFLINEGSSVEMEFDYQEVEWALSGEFNGRAILIINSETMGDIGLENWPKGMDFSYQALQFEGLTINKGDTGCGSDLSDQYGIGDIEFGTWGVLDDTKDIRESLKEKEGDTSKPDAKEKTAGKDKTNNPPATTGRPRSNALANNDKRLPIQKPTTRERSNSLVKKDPRRPTPKGRARSNATYGGQAPKKEKPTPEPEFNAMSLSAEVTGIRCIDDNNFELGLNITVNILGDNEVPKEKEQETKTCSLNAESSIGVQFSVGTNKKFNPTGIVLNCMKFGGSIGPVTFDGGLNILRATNERTQWGQGFKAYLNGSIQGLGGLALVGQFGKIKYTEGGIEEKYTYGFLDIEAFIQSGIAIPPITPTSAPVIDIYGVGGGLRINMELQTAAQELEMKKNPAKAPGNDNCTIGENLLAAGKGFSNNFIPKKGTYGGNIYFIFGPYNIADEGPAPQYQLLSDAGFDIEIGRNEKGAMQFNSFYVNAKAYIKPESIGKRRTENIADAYANVGYDNRLKKIIGDFGFRAKLDLPKVGTVLKMPIAYDEGKYNTGYMDIGFSPMSFSVKFGGPGYNGWKPTSGLSRLDAILSVPNVVDVSAFAYFQIGKNVDAVPPLEYLIPKLKDAKNKEEIPKNRDNDALNRAANGIAFGANIDLKAGLSYGPMDANLNAGIGFDLNLSERKGVTCANLEHSQIGIKGWYAIGQAYAYANGKINLHYNLIFASGRVKIFDVNGFMYIKAMIPNPSYLKGRLTGDYSVLGGRLSGSFNYKVEIGQQCEGIQPPSPIEGMEIFANANIEKEQTNVDRYTDIQIATNLALQQDFDLEQLNVEGEVSSTASYRADLKEIYVVKKGSTTRVPYVMTRNPNKKGFKMEFNSPLDALTDYEINYTFVWQKKEVKNGTVSYIENFESKKGDKDLKPKIETGIISFKTGDLPQNIQNTMVEYVAPGNKQRYWHKGYADTELKFKLNALGDAMTLFPDECIACTQANGGKKVEFEYFVQLVEHDGAGKPLNTFRIPVTNRPSQSEKAKILNWEKVSLNNGEYQLNVLTEKDVPVSKVSFPGLNNIDLVKGSLYELKIIRKPKMEAQQNVTQSNSNQVNRQIQTSEISDKIENDVMIAVKEEKNELAKMSQALRNAINENTKILYTSHFAVSNYNTLQDKLALVEVKHQRSITKRRDFEHPNDVYDDQRAKAIQAYGESKFHSTKDDYYVLNIKNNNLEGFDEFDLNRIRRNATLNYSQNYTAQERLYGERYFDFTNYKKQDIPAQLVKVLDSEVSVIGFIVRPYEAISGYMKKVLFDYREAENKGVATYGNSRFSDGTKWHYNINLPDDPKARLLQDDEIRDKKVIHKNKGYTMTSDPNYSKPVFGNAVEFDLLVQDLRSRIIINQMVWLSRLSKGKNDGWFNGNYPEGEYLNETRTASNFNWVLYKTQSEENSQTVSSGTFIAQEPGYQFSYHGSSTLSFPSDTKWGEITESKRDKNPGAASNTFANMTPSRDIGFNEEFKVDNYTELLTDSWYKIKYKGEPLYVNNSNFWGLYLHEKWSVDFPYTNFKYAAGQYGIYSGAKGMFLSEDYFRTWDDSDNDEDAVWNIVGSPGTNKANILNYYAQKKNRDAKLSTQLKNRKDLIDRKVKVNNVKDFADNSFEFIEIPELNVSPDKWYKISVEDNRYIYDMKNSNKWRIIRDGKFYRIISSNGQALKGHHYTEGWISVDTHHELKRDEGFPVNKNDKNDYYRSVWDITMISYDPKNPVYTIRNVRYQDHFLTVYKDKTNWVPTIRTLDFGQSNPYIKNNNFVKFKIEPY